MTTSRTSKSVWIPHDLYAQIEEISRPHPPRKFIREALYQALERAQTNDISSSVRAELARMSAAFDRLAETLPEMSKPAGYREVDAAIAILVCRVEQLTKLAAQLIVTSQEHYGDALAAMRPAKHLSDKTDTLAENYRTLTARLNGELAQMTGQEGLEGSQGGEQ